jgi:hypothetical protein
MKEHTSKVFEDLMNSIPLSTRVKTAIEAYFIEKHGGSFFMPASEEGEEYDEIVRINTNAYKEAQPIIDIVLETIKEYEK